MDVACVVCKEALAPTAQYWVCNETGCLCRDHFLNFAEWLEQNTAMEQILYGWRLVALTIHVRVMTMAGTGLCELDVKRGTSIGEVRKRIAEERGDPRQWRSYRLLCGTQLLEDYMFLDRRCGCKRSISLSSIVDRGGSESDSDTDMSNRSARGSTPSSWSSCSLSSSEMVFFHFVGL